MAFKKFSQEQIPAWKPNKGDTIEGLYVEKRQVNTKNGLSNIFTIEKKGGEKVAVWESAQLAPFFQNIKIGNLVRITSRGKETNPKTGRQFNAYDLEVDDSLVTQDDIDNLFTK